MTQCRHALILTGTVHRPIAYCEYIPIYTACTMSEVRYDTMQACSDTRSDLTDTYSLQYILGPVATGGAFRVNAPQKIFLPPQMKIETYIIICTGH